jgi:mannose-1-phosphate guanylyltransferase
MIKNIQHKYTVIVAGGLGTRLWPVSRKSLPKQMQKFISDRTLIDETVERVAGILPKDHIFIATNAGLAEPLKELLPEIPVENYIIEPVARGTTPAFALLARTIEKRDPKAIVVSLASDHAISELDIFHKVLSEALEYTEKNPKKITLIGIKPDKPDTGLGYIRVADKVNSRPTVYNVNKFVEKPSYKIAQKYVESGRYYWNAAYYCFAVKTFIKAYEDVNPNLIKYVDKFLASGKAEDFEKVPAEGHEIEIIDDNKFPMVLVPADFKWSDIGNWQALHGLIAERSGSGEVATMLKGEHIDLDSKNYMIHSTVDGLIATSGLDSVAIIHTNDVLLVLNKDNPASVKEIIEKIKEHGLEKYL